MANATEQVARDLANSLWIVPTPLGNMTDLSCRAIACLSQVGTIFCEDTRITETLLRQLGRTKMPKLVRADQHREHRNWSPVFESVDWNQGAALVSDAGTPGVSDPGSGLIEAAVIHGVQVRPIPGPSAVVMLASILPWNAVPWVFRGFFPRSESEQEAEWKWILGCDASIFWFESPKRISSAIRFLASKNPSAQVVVAKELTKIHEQIWIGPLERISKEILAHLDQVGELGEWVLALAPSAGNEKPADEPWKLALELLIQSGVKASEASRRISDAYAVAKNRVYDFALNIRSKINPEK